MGIAELDYQRHKQMTADFIANQAAKVRDCKICKGTGRLIKPCYDGDIPDVKTLTCKCSVQRALRTLLFESGMPREFWEVEHLIPDLNVHAFAQVEKYADNIDNVLEHGLGLILTGKNGAGKTSSSCIPLIKCARKRKSIAFISFPDYVDGLRRAWKEPALSKHLDERICRDLIVLDELGKEHRTADDSFVLQKLDSLLRLRRGSCLPTIITTNLNYTQLCERYGQSIASMLSDKYKVLNYRPGDFRRRTPKKSWDDLLGGAE